MQPPISELSATDDFEQRIECFEAAWENGPRPNIAAHLLGATAMADLERRRLLEELIKVDLDFRWRRRLDAGDPGPVRPDDLPDRPRLEDYVECYPLLGPLVELPSDLILGEYEVRH